MEENNKRVKDYSINEIKNINLIYVFSKESIFKNLGNKFVGLTVVYADGKKVLKIDYKDPNFARVINRYEKEKNRRKIVLLGDYTKNFIEKQDFQYEEKQSLKKEQIPYFSWEDKLVCKYQKYLYDLLELIIKQLYKCETFKIESLDGFKNTYSLNYKISFHSRKTKMIICPTQDGIDFKMASIDGTNNIIYGSICGKVGGIFSSFKVGDYSGYIDYNLIDKEISKSIDVLGNTIFFDSIEDTILDEDKDIVDFYLKFIGDKSFDNLIKINDETFIVYEKSDMEFEELEDKNNIYTSSETLINIYDNIVRIIKTKKEGITKLEGFVESELSSNVEEINLRRFENLIIIEKNNNGDYSYQIMKDNNIDFKSPFDNSNIKDIDVTSIDDVKQYTHSKEL